MEKHNNFQSNFSLKGYASIQIGLYFLVVAFAIKKILDGFLIDDNPLGMLSPEIIEILIYTILFFTILFSSLALFFKGRRKARKLNYQLWNRETKVTFWKYLVSYSLIFATLFLLSKLGYVNYITPVFLVLYGLSLLFLRIKKSKNLYILSGVCLFLALICFLIPTYWSSSIYILGIAHITYGLVDKK